MHKMATKRIPQRKIINIAALHETAKRDVIAYRDMVDQLCYLIQNHPEVQQKFLIDTLLHKFGVSEDWFIDMQENHRQSIIDSVRGKHE